MALDWSILRQGQPVDIAGNFATGYKMGEAMINRFHQSNALAALAQNPDDNAALMTLYQVNPDLADHLEAHGIARAKVQRDNAARNALSSYIMNRSGNATDATVAPSGTGTAPAAAPAVGGDSGWTTLVQADPEKALAVKKQLDDMSDGDRVALQKQYSSAAPLAYQALKLPYEQRKAYIESVKPELGAAGWTADKVDAFDPTDANLGGIVQSAMTLDQAMGRDKVDYREVMPGARLVPFDATGRPLTSDAGQAQTPSPPTSGDAGGANNNPGALRKPGSMEFQSFATPQQGVKAQEALLGRYMGRGLNNVANIVETYAPRQSRGGDNTDAQVNNYIGYVAQRLGVNPQDALSPTMVPKLAQAMREFETGHRANNALSAASIREHAQEAIAAGADPAAVKARAASMGVSL